MKFYTLFRCVLLPLLAIISCNAQTKKKIADTAHRTVERDPWSPRDSLDYVALRDSSKLLHIKNQFYRDKKGKLFEKMCAPKNPIDIDAGIVTFFRVANPDIDPLTFEIIGGSSWFAKDKNHIYNYRGNDSGMFCITMSKANVKFFRLLPDNSGIYGADNKHVFEETDVIENIDPKIMHLVVDKDRNLVQITSGRYIFMSSWGSFEARLIKTTIKHKRSIAKSKH